nr:tetratricopeptide repeat protein 36 homolog [Leptinotarsa decemlineata]
MSKLSEHDNTILNCIFNPHLPAEDNISYPPKKLEDALNDATKAINLSTDKYKRTLCLAYCQRGILHRKAENMEMAREDFENAAKMGNDFAKKQLIELNPYAALCNQMLRQVMDTWN